MDSIYIKVEELNSWIAKYFQKKDLITIEDLLGTIEDLDSEVSRLEERCNELENDMHDNYKPIKKEEQYDMHDHNFH